MSTTQNSSEKKLLVTFIHLKSCQMFFNSLSLLNFFGIFDYATLKNYISAVIYSSISNYTSLERAKIKLSERKIFRPQ